MAFTLTTAYTWTSGEVDTATKRNTAGVPTLADGQTYGFGLGSAAAPSMAFTGDSNTGVYSPGADQVAVAAGGSQVVYVTTSGASVTGSLSATNGMSAIGALNALRTASNATNSTTKESRWVASHYLNAEEDMMVVYPFSDSTSNTVAYGGGASANNAATRHDFYAAANNTTTTGTLIASISSTGLAVTGALSATGSVKVYSGVTASLPSANPAGQIAFVTDSTQAQGAGGGSILTGGGANYRPVYSDGTNWRQF